MEIRLALPCEAPALAALGARLFRATYGEQVPQADIEQYVAANFTAEAQAREIAGAGAAVLVAADASGLMAYAQLRSSTPPLAGAEPGALEIARFYLDSRLHGKGLAGALMAACLDWARGQGKTRAWLQVWELNPRAMAFYAKQGFADGGQTSFQLGGMVYVDRVWVRSLK